MKIIFYLVIELFIYLNSFSSFLSSIKKNPAVGIQLCCARRSRRGFVYLEGASGSHDFPGMCFRCGSGRVILLLAMYDIPPVDA